jgi:hypothetical protein
MKYILFAILLRVASCTDITGATQPVEEWIPLDSTFTKVNCQLIIRRSYIYRIDGIDHQISHSIEVIGEPCNKEQNTKE